METIYLTALSVIVGLILGDDDDRRWGRSQP